MKVGLSERERQVLSLIAEGKEDKQIALILDISLSTVKQYMKNILVKYDVGNRTHALALAVYRGEIKLRGK